MDLFVRGIALGDGPGAYGLSNEVFAPLATAQRIVHSNEINVVRISAPGGVEPTRSSFEELGRAVTRLGIPHLGSDR